MKTAEGVSVSETPDLEVGNGRQVSVVLSPGVIKIITDEATRRHIGRSTYLRQLIADHALELVKRNNEAA